MIVDVSEATFERVEEFGQKGASLGDMARLGLDVPPGFIIPTRVCREYFERGAAVLDEVMAEARRGVEELERKTGRIYGAGDRPLMVSVRSGAAAPMPGIMETMLDLGMNPHTVLALINETGDARFAYDCYQRFISAYGRIVFDLDDAEFDEAIASRLDRAGVASLDHLGQEHLKKLADRFVAIIKKQSGRDIPADPYEQLRDAIEAVFRSWNSPQAMTYRNLRRIEHSNGTAVIVQAMVFGNLGKDSAVGTVFTRDPIYGTKRPSGTYLTAAQGEEIQEGRRTPRSIVDYMPEEFPQAYEKLRISMDMLEKNYRSIQEIEFTIERGRVCFLQTRTAECTARATVKAAVDMVSEGLITREEAIMRVRPESLTQLLFRYIDPSEQLRSLTRGSGSSPGAAFGLVAFDAEKAEEIKKDRREVVLVRPQARPEDLEGLSHADGLLIAGGTISSHAFGMIRRVGKPCVSGCPDLNIDLENRTFTVGHTTIEEGDVITIDGNTGRVYRGTVKTRESEISEEFRELLGWADGIRRLEVRGNADTPEDVKRALEFGAAGIGLCRTEAMFMAADRLPVMQALILVDEEEEQQELLAQLRDIQKRDFAEIFRTLNGLPVTFRLLDPPLHEFIPELEPLMTDVYEMRYTGRGDESLKFKEALLQRVLSHREENPMLGLRGCRLGLMRPEIVRMQVSAIIESACEVAAEGVTVKPEILIPLVGHVNELKAIRKIIDEAAREVMSEKGMEIAYRVGTLIEVPRAALTAAELAAHSDFFSFGTNDLTQMTFALSRDDSVYKFLGFYTTGRLLDVNPFYTLDHEGVGRLIRITVDDARGARPDLTLGLSGEHGADPDTISFCHALGIHYVSCSPHQAPMARLAAAQAELKQSGAAKSH